MKLRKVVSVFLASMTALSLVACNSGGDNKEADTAGASAASTSASQDAGTTDNNASSNKVVLTVTYRETGDMEKSALYRWLTAAYESYDKKDSIELNIAPITASEGDYFAKIALALQSADTAPDIVTEDTFQLATDVSAGYLTKLDDMLANYSDWNNGSYYESLKEVVTTDSGTYGIPYSTDTRGLWYNKELFKEAGLPEDWQPENWADILAACKTIKEKLPDVVPFWCNSGVATGEGTSMQTYEMLLYGTGERLLDEDTGKWIIASQGILDSLNFLNDIYSNGYGPSLSKVLNGQAGNTATQEYLPQGKLAILLDGYWITGNYLEEGASPWPEYSEVLGFAAMPMQYGQGTVTLSGGWAWSIPEKAKSKEEAFDFITHLMETEIYTTSIINQGNISTRTDVTSKGAYSERPFMEIATEFLDGASFRPKDEKYSEVSTHIQAMVEAVVSGTSPEDAMETYAADVTRVVGEDNVIRK